MTGVDRLPSREYAGLPMPRLISLLRNWFGPAEPPAARHALWSIGLYAGPSPLELTPAPGTPNPVLTREQVTDADASFVADPFLLRADGTWHLFFELLNRATGRGEIGLATSSDLVKWRYDRIVLAEPFHLSYPQVFEWRDVRYMLPESHQANAVRLYEADVFPTRWRHVHTLLDGDRYSDTTVFRHDERWWLFTQTSPEGKHDNLRLFSADDLFGPWTEHPASPIVNGDARAARPAGRVVVDRGRLLRFAQDCTTRYGLKVWAFEITQLSRTAYEERPASGDPILAGSSTGWNAARMHHVDAHIIRPGQWIAAVDGAYNATRREVSGSD